MTKDVFVENDEIVYWRFEVIYSFESETSVGVFDMQVNTPPKHGSCSVDPLNGTMMTSFNIHCFNWTDQDGIRDYSFYGWYLFLLFLEIIIDEMMF